MGSLRRLMSGGPSISVAAAVPGPSIEPEEPQQQAPEAADAAPQAKHDTGPRTAPAEEPQAEPEAEVDDESIPVGVLPPVTVDGVELQLDLGDV